MLPRFDPTPPAVGQISVLHALDAPFGTTTAIASPRPRQKLKSSVDGSFGSQHETEKIATLTAGEHQTACLAALAFLMPGWPHTLSMHPLWPRSIRPI